MTPEQMTEKLAAAYPEGKVDVTDLTGSQDHYSVWVKSSKFEGQSRIQRHKSVMAVFDSELKSGEVHALTIRTETA